MMLNKAFTQGAPLFEPQDHQIYEEEIAPFLPEKVFDAHAHMLIPEYHPALEEQIPLTLQPGLGRVHMQDLMVWWRALFPQAKVRGMVMGFPTRGCDLKAENEEVAQESRAACMPFSMLTHPQTSPELLEAQVQQWRPVGLKPYMCHVEGKPVNEASLADLIPRDQVAVANQYGLSITLHVAKAQGMADRENIAELIELAQAFPKAKFVLAHCGRCFLRRNMSVLLDVLPDLPNVYFDTSAVCNLGVFLELFTRGDLKRVLFGTDLVTATGFRGAYVGLGTTWHTCNRELLGVEARPTFVAYENLRQLLYAARFCALSSEVIEDIFWRNAQGLWSLAP